MNPVHNDFVRKLGRLRIHIQHLDDSLRTNNLNSIESESQEVQDLLLELMKQRRKLSSVEQQSLRPRFMELRHEALRCLEAARRILDDSLEAMLWLVKAVQDTGNYGSTPSGSSMLIDRQA
jgi:hypothetical protein